MISGGLATAMEGRFFATHFIDDFSSKSTTKQNFHNSKIILQSKIFIIRVCVHQSSITIFLNSSLEMADFITSSCV